MNGSQFLNIDSLFLASAALGEASSHDIVIVLVSFAGTGELPLGKFPTDNFPQTIVFWIIALLSQKFPSRTIAPTPGNSFPNNSHLG